MSEALTLGAMHAPTDIMSTLQIGLDKLIQVWMLKDADFKSTWYDIFPSFHCMYVCRLLHISRIRMDIDNSILHMYSAAEMMCSCAVVEYTQCDLTRCGSVAKLHMRLKVS
jgi:hypothetical protein